MIEFENKKSMNSKISNRNYQPLNKNKEFQKQPERKIKVKRLQLKNNLIILWLILFFRTFIRMQLLAYTKKIYTLTNFSMP